MSKRNIGYIIELSPKYRPWIYAYSDNLKDAEVFSTREKAREDKRSMSGLRLETIHQVALDCNGRPVSIIKKVR